MRGLGSGRFVAAAALVVSLGILVVPPPAAGAPAPAPTAQGSTAGAGWDVTPAGARAWVVRLTLPTPVPVRAAQPQLAVDGVVLGTATQDRDGRTLRLRTADPRVVTAGRVELAWNGRVEGAVVPRGQTPDPSPAPTASGPVLAEDPAAATTYRVERADYDLGDSAVRLPGLGGQAVELRAAVYLPAGAPGRRPVVVFLHGRHQPCYGRPGPVGTPFPPSWPCPGGSLPVPSHLGYGQAADALAAAGYVVVSISADGINALDFGATDGGAQARGELVLAHLDRLRAWDAGQVAGGQGAALVGRLDLTRVGLMGHSRGGEGVVKAALLNAERPAPYGIRAVMPLAPTDFGRATLPGVPMAVVLPYCDGDVSDQQGQHFHDDTRYATPDDALRTSLLVMGANHNYFNSEWTPGVSTAPSSDDWYLTDDPVCGPGTPTRLTPAQQRAVGAAYVAGFFRLHLGGERGFLPMFDGSGARAPSVRYAVVLAEAQQPRSSRTDLAPLQGPTRAVQTTRGAAYCASYGAPVAGQLPPCATGSQSPGLLPHWTPAFLAPSVPATPMLRMTWNATVPDPSATVAVPPGTAARQALSFRTAPAVRARADLLVTLTDAAGHRASVPVSRVSAALSPLPSVGGLDVHPGPKTWLRTVRMPLAAFAGVDPATLSTVTFAASGATGDVFLSDVALDTPAAGSGGPSPLPAVSIGDAQAFVGAEPVRVGVAVTLSRPSTRAVTVQLQLGAVGADDRVRSRAVAVTVPAGSTRVTVPFAIRGNARGDGGLVEYENSLSVPTGAIVGDALGTLQVYSDGGSGVSSG